MPTKQRCSDKDCETSWSSGQKNLSRTLLLDRLRKKFVRVPVAHSLFVSSHLGNESIYAGHFLLESRTGLLKVEWLWPQHGVTNISKNSHLQWLCTCLFMIAINSPAEKEMSLFVCTTLTKSFDYSCTYTISPKMWLFFIKGSEVSEMKTKSSKSWSYTISK